MIDMIDMKLDVIFNARDEKIIQWLREQDWYPQFCKNLREYNNDIGLHLYFNSLGSSAIMTAFYWEGTPEGAEFWGNANRDFERWYFTIFLKRF